MFGMLKSKSKNQGPKARFYELLEKYKNGTITEAEAWELKQLLEEEKAKKEKKGQEAEALLIGLILIGILLWLASRKE